MTEQQRRFLPSGDIGSVNDRTGDEPLTDVVLRMVAEHNSLRSEAQALIASRIIVDLPSKCFNWTLSHDRQGYALAHFKGVTIFGHRLAYAAHIGPIPEGSALDHLCRNTGCVNPWHLEPVTWAENMRRGKQANQTHCKHGHEYTPENTYRMPNGRRDCRVCIRDRQRRHRAMSVSS